jgi:hypothetical protein
MTIKGNLKISKSFADILEEIISGLKEGNTVLVPELLALLASIEEFVVDEKVKEILAKAIKILEDANTITPDVITLLEDIVKLIK